MSALEFTLAKAIVRWHDRHHGADTPIEMLRYGKDRRTWQAVIIVPSAKRIGWWQLSFFDAYGFYGDSQHPSKLDAIEEAMLDKYYILSHGRLDQAMRSRLWQSGICPPHYARALKSHTRVA
ncbi:MAG: hypothetical protein IDH49_08100 [Gammaproteobacteria bacterium]|nr:hypothetical protein [Gammaproteobacteria bacterium]